MQMSYLNYLSSLLSHKEYELRQSMEYSTQHIISCRLVLDNNIWISFGLLFLFLFPKFLGFLLFILRKIRLLLFLLILVFVLFVLLLLFQYLRLSHPVFVINFFDLLVQIVLLMLHKFPIVIDLVLYYFLLLLIVNRNKNYVKLFGNLNILYQVFKIIKLFLSKVPQNWY